MDPIRAAIDAAAAQTAWAPALAALAGAATSFGPCVAPRFVAVAALLAGRSGAARWKLWAAFTSGLCAAYMVVGVTLGLAGRIALQSDYVYAGLALALGLGGMATLLRPSRDDGCRAHAPDRASHGGALLLGGSFALVTSPCCTPVVAALAGVSAASANPWFGAGTLGAFALGHALPLAAAGIGSGRVVDVLRRWKLEPALATVGGALMLALSGYYALLA
jgi:cytochrome c biogenesis protein CcdA